MPVPAARATLAATASGASANPFSKSALTGSGAAAAMRARCASTSSSGTPPSGRPAENAMPALVVASAGKPSAAR